MAEKAKQEMLKAVKYPEIEKGVGMIQLCPKASRALQKRVTKLGVMEAKFKDISQLNESQSSHLVIEWLSVPTHVPALPSRLS